MLRTRAAGAFASAVMAIGLLSPVASAQSERIVAPEERDDYVAEFYVDPDNPPVIDGVPALTETEIDEYREKILQAEAFGPPQDEIAPGQMWSDRVGLPEGVDKAEADQSEVTLAREQSQPQAMSLPAAATRCQTFWLAPQVCGAILERYEQLGGLTSWLAFPLEPMSPNPDGQGQRQRFAGGYIYWHPETGAHAVPNITVPVWERNGWESGWLGYPLGGEVSVQGSNLVDGEINGWVQLFQGGRIYRSPVLEGFQIASINGLILDRWLELGGPNSDLGFPITDEAGTPDGEGRFSTFQHGMIYWHPNHGAHSLSGSVLDKWTESGFETGQFGYPISEPSHDDGLKMVQKFEHGDISGYAEPIPSIVDLLPMSESELDETYELLKADFAVQGIPLRQGFQDAFKSTQESYNYTLEQLLGEAGSSQKQGVKSQNYMETKAVIDPRGCTFISPGNERTNRGDIFYSAAIRFGVVNHGHNGIFVTKGNSNPANIETVEAVGSPDGVKRLSGSNRRGVCRPVYLSVKTSNEIRNGAAAFAESKVGADYNSNFLTTRIGSLDKSSYNCSQLLWAAFKRASGGGLDIGERYPYQPYQAAVYPLDILKSHKTVEFS